MKNFEIYRKTLGLSFLRLGCSLLGLAAFLGLPVLACVLTANAAPGVTITACVVGLLLGVFAMWAIGHFYTYLLEAGQVAMITKGITEGALPENVVAEARAAVKHRFATVAVYYAIHSAIKAITGQINRAVNSVAEKFSDSKNSVVSFIALLVELVIGIVLSYVSYCCLGWVFFKSEQSPVKATLDGAVLYFQNWKALMKNVGKVLLILFLTLLLVFGPVFVGIVAVSDNSVGMQTMGHEIAEFVNGMELTEENDDGVEEPVVMDADSILVVFDAAVAFIVAVVIYKTLVSPYVLVSFMRGYLEAGIANPPAVSLYDKLAGLSKRFKKEMTKREAPGMV